MQIAIINYNAGNIRSVLFALERLGITATLTADAATIQAADGVIFPGVGEASTTMEFLRERGLDEVIKNLVQPTLAICLGMQLLCTHSEENDTPCLGIVPRRVRRFRSDNGQKVPHMGWNTLTRTPRTWLSETVEQQHVYFVHSYYVEIGPEAAATTDYGQPFCSVLQHQNFFATQFHPEKSGAVGEQIIRDFLSQVRQSKQAAVAP